MVLVSAWLLLAGCDTAVDVPHNDSDSHTPGLKIGPIGNGPQAAAVDLSSAVSVAPDGRLYGCVLSAHPEGDTSGPYQYRYAQLAFPEAVAEKALGEQRLTYRLRTEDGLVLRQATCLIPATAEARDLVLDWVGLPDTGDGWSSGSSTDDDPKNPTPILYNGLNCDRDGDGPDDVSWSEECDEVVVTADPIAIDDGGGGGGGWWDPIPPDSGWSAPWDDPSGGPGSGGDDDENNDNENEDECGGSTGGGSDSPPPTGGDDPCGADCYDPPTDDGTGGGGGDGPHDAPGFMVGATWHVVTSSGLIAAPYDPAGYTLLNAGCDTADDPVPKEEVASVIREACQDMPGLTLPGDDGALWPYFQASVRSSLNATLPGMRQYQWTDRREDQPPQLSNLVDGYAEAFTDDGTHIPGLVTSILEVKFSHNPSGSMSTGQWQTHINDLQSFYDQLPDHDYQLGSPLYLLVTNSEYSSVDNLGGDESVRIPEYASERGVNVMHLRVTKNALGDYDLQGGLIGTSDLPSTIASFLTEVEVNFQAVCEGES